MYLEYMTQRENISTRFRNDDINFFLFGQNINRRINSTEKKAVVMKSRYDRKSSGALACVGNGISVVLVDDPLESKCPEYCGYSSPKNSSHSDSRSDRMNVGWVPHTKAAMDTMTKNALI